MVMIIWGKKNLAVIFHPALLKLNGVLVKSVEFEFIVIMKQQ